MSTQSNKQKKPKLPDFVATVRDALKLYKKPKELGEKSPLAAPYFLGNHLKPSDTMPEDRGRALAGLFREIIEQDITDPLYQQILKRRYFEGRSAGFVEAETGFSRARYNDYQSAATAEVGLQLVKRVRRTLYLEYIPTAPNLFERDDVHQRLLHLLLSSKGKAPKTIILTGSGGMGKTSLSSQIAAAWKEENAPVFWYTIRPGLTDQLEALFFNLAYFLDQAGQSIPWLDLVSKQGAVKPEPMLGLLRAAIANLDQKPLLCFDELDLLDANKNDNHEQIIEFMNALRGTTPMLWIGQQVRFDADHIETLDGLSLEAIRALCIDRGIHITGEQLTQLQMDTLGNPRLLTLFIALYQTGEDVDIILDELHRSPSVEHLLNRIVSRLDETERQVLMQLAVFRGSAPRDIWQSKAMTNIALQKIFERRLIQDNRDGSVTLLPAYRGFILKELAQDKLRQLHSFAAAARSRIAQYTEAIYHLIESNQPEGAIELWASYHQQEINQGQGMAALILLRRLKDIPLPEVVQQKLHNLCAELEHLHGNSEQAMQDLHAVLRTTPVLRIEALELEGMIENDQGHFDKARTAFENALTTAENLFESQLALLHKGLGWSYMREWNLEKARYEAEYASYEAEDFRGSVLEEQNHYVEAEKTYLSALSRAIEIDHTQGIAKAANNLVRLQATMGKSESAKMYHERAKQAYLKSGRAVGAIGCDVNLALVHMLEGDYAETFKILAAIEQQWQQIGVTIQPQQKSLIELMRAEAYVGQEDWASAEKSLDYVFEDEAITNQPDAMRIRGELMAGQGNHEAALISIRQSISLSEQEGVPYLEAYAWRALGKVYQAMNESTEADAAFGKAIALFTDLELSHEVERTEQLSIK